MAANKFPNGLDFNVDVVAQDYVQGNLVKATNIAKWKVLGDMGLQYESGKSLAQFAAKAVYSVAIVEVSSVQCIHQSKNLYLEMYKVCVKIFFLRRVYYVRTY